MGQSTANEVVAGSLTKRQGEVASLVARNYSYKEIARELNISEDRVQKLVAAIKLRWNVHSRRGIAERWRLESHPDEWQEKPATGETDLPDDRAFWPMAGLDEPHVLRQEEEAMNAFSSIPEEPRIVPRLLDGKHRILARLAVIAGVIATTFVAIILAVAAIRSVSELVGGTAPDQALERKTGLHAGRPGDLKWTNAN